MRLAQQLTYQENAHLRRVVGLARWEGFIIGIFVGGFVAAVSLAAYIYLGVS